ncbi:MAG: carboxy-S-adenosyl-L-methionine synthase CmoA [Pseudomonadota bacterium]
MTKDIIYRNDLPSADFTFNAGVADVFDDMLQRSVPCYRQVIDMVAALLARFVGHGETICDLGCSTGTTLMELSRLLAPFGLNFIGIDNSAPMIDKAQLKAKMLSRTDRVHFICGDIAETDLPPCRAFIINYTLQFIRPMIRKTFLTRLHDALLPGGVVIISEKIIFHDPLLNRAFIDFYHDFKKSQGYTETEIARKREALENVLIPFSTGENIQLLRDAGFSHVEPFFQWFNFASYIAMKD